MKKISKLDVFRAFRSRNYSLYFVGRSVSQFGTWMQRTAVIWVVYSMTHSAFLIGVTIFAEQFPSFLFSIPGGVAADRYDRYKIIHITQIVSMAQSVLLAILVLTGHAEVWAILVLSVVLGIINAFDVPARQSMTHEVVSDPADLPNAVALTTSMASFAQLAGPAISGIILSAFGAPVCFFINAASFGGVSMSLLLMKLPNRNLKKSQKKVMTEFVDGFSYVVKTTNIGVPILMMGIMSLLVLPYNTVLPVFAKVIFSGNAKTFGYINSFVGLGAMIGTIFLASRRPGVSLKKMLLTGSVILSVGLMCFSQVRNFPLAMFFAMLAGFGGMAQFTAGNIIVQSESATEMRGRAIGIMLMALFGMMPLGSLVTGAVSQHIGAPATVLIQGIIGLVVAMVFIKFLLKPRTVIIADKVLIEEVQEVIAEKIE